MKVYVLLIFSNDKGPGSIPSVQCEVFSDPTDRYIFTERWIDDLDLTTEDNEIFRPKHPSDFEYWFVKAEKEVLKYEA